ncbi:MAG: hypothetical protein JWQ34_1651 [Mucilaginibacter sp.]|nr:hypothetical protein [Mucilaginibacter sp.]
MSVKHFNEYIPLLQSLDLAPNPLKGELLMCLFACEFNVKVLEFWFQMVYNPHPSGTFYPL